ncbi:MAG: DUF177 domain-containing protein [Sphingomonadales bacterium]|nr:DUF177 domain-containing protein [Sphingomonadales bacterium]MBD3774528.1 DUF177 domain-containing protein [Paracoccaceae bacterium]
MSGPVEFSRMIAARHLPAKPVELVADEKERAALATRFGISSVDHLRAEISLEAHGAAIGAKGKLWADITQPCAISGDDFATSIEEALDFRFVHPANHATPDEEIELDAGDCDEIEFEGEQFDLGEAVAQSLGLAIDPYATGPGADQARRDAGLLDEGAAGPFAALAALKKDK